LSPCSPDGLYQEEIAITHLQSKWEHGRFTRAISAAAGHYSMESSNAY
jgi:hypothetical protein